MLLPYRFKVYRYACIVSLLLMGGTLLNVAWMLTAKGAYFQFQAGIFLIGIFFFINYKNAMAGLSLHNQLADRQPIPSKQRRSLKIYWVLQLLVQLFIGMQLIGSLSRLLLRFKLGLMGNYPTAALLSDFLGLLNFLTATVCLICFGHLYAMCGYNTMRCNKPNAEAVWTF